MNFYNNKKILEINGFLFLKEDSNNFFNSLLCENIKKKEILDFSYIHKLLKNINIEYILIIIPDKVIMCMELFENNFFNAQNIVSRRSIALSQKYDYVHYKTNNFGLRLADIV